VEERRGQGHSRRRADLALALLNPRGLEIDKSWPVRIDFVPLLLDSGETRSSGILIVVSRAIPRWWTYVSGVGWGSDPAHARFEILTGFLRRKYK
jgi:hypothetical protein